MPMRTHCTQFARGTRGLDRSGAAGA
jgi:hypothetical protein